MSELRVYLVIFFSCQHFLTYLAAGHAFYYQSINSCKKGLGRHYKTQNSQQLQAPRFVS